MFGTQELLIVAAILFLLFGATRLPSLMRSLGRSVNEFKTGLREEPADPKRLEDDEESVDAKRLEEKEKVSR